MNDGGICGGLSGAVRLSGPACELGRRIPHRYRAFGLAICSDLALPELESDDAEVADVAIRLRTIGRPLPETPRSVLFEFGPDSQYLAWLRVGGFLIRGVGDIDIHPAPGVDEPLLHLPLLGPVMALLLHLRGLLVLHASAVEMANRSAIFLGDKRAGKSTTAVALVAAGHRLLADDVLAIDFSASDSPKIVPAFPQLKLDLKAAETILEDDAVILPPVIPGFEKWQHRLTDHFSHASVPPTHIYVLARGSNAALTPLTAQDALTALIRFSFVTRFPAAALSRAAAGAHFRQCAALADSVRVCRLEVPSGLDRLGELVRLVESDLA